MSVNVVLLPNAHKITKRAANAALCDVAENTALGTQLRSLASAILGLLIGLQPAAATKEQVQRFQVQGHVIYVDVDSDYYDDD